VPSAAEDIVGGLAPLVTAGFVGGAPGDDCVPLEGAYAYVRPIE
jgi:hypothetical protein